MVLLAVIVIPNFVPARFASSGEPIHFKIRVVTQDGGTPIQDAEVQINAKQAVTDADGQCDIEQSFPAHGVVGRSGECSLGGDLRVTARGFAAWEQELPALFGKSYDYFNKGKQITYVVALTK